MHLLSRGLWRLHGPAGQTSESAPTLPNYCHLPWREFPASLAELDAPACPMQLYSGFRGGSLPPSPCLRRARTMRLLSPCGSCTGNRAGFSIGSQAQFYLRTILLSPFHHSEASEGRVVSSENLLRNRVVSPSTPGGQPCRGAARSFWPVSQCKGKLAESLEHCQPVEE